MAPSKKIRIDFSKAEDSSNWNTRPIPAGVHEAKITVVQQTEAQDGTAMLIFGFRPTDSKLKTRHFPYYCKLQQNQLWKLRDLLIAAGQSVPKKALSIDPNVVVGKIVAIEVEDDTYNGNLKSQIQAVYDTEILDDQDDISDDEDLEENEFDEEDDFEEDSDEDDDFDDEDVDEDEFDEDEDDLDDDFDDDEDELEEEEDDFDEDEEEEEEPEPAPAPKRRTVKRRASAPAKSTKRRK